MWTNCQLPNDLQRKVIGTFGLEYSLKIIIFEKKTFEIASTKQAIM